MELSIIGYSINKENIQSSFLFKLHNDIFKQEYTLNIPLNPLIDIEILKIFNFSFEDKLLKLNDLVKKKHYSYQTIESLKRFIDWINNILNNNDNIII